jgi:hypothetical protein
MMLGVVLRCRCQECRNLLAAECFDLLLSSHSRCDQPKQARLDAGLTQIEVAKALRKPQSFVSKIESGEGRVDVVDLSDFARLYRRNVSFFISG